MALRVLRCPKLRKVLVLATVCVPMGAGHKQRLGSGGGRAERTWKSKNNDRGWQGGVPLCCGSWLRRFLSVPPPRLLPSKLPQRGASVSGSHPPRQVAASSRMSGAHRGRGRRRWGCVSPLLHPSHHSSARSMEQRNEPTPARGAGGLASGDGSVVASHWRAGGSVDMCPHLTGDGKAQLPC